MPRLHGVDITAAEPGRVPSKPPPEIMTYQLPCVLDDAAVEEIGTQLRGLASDCMLGQLRLDATYLHELSTRGLGLLAALHAISTHRGARLEVFGCTPAVRDKLLVLRIPAAAHRMPSPPRREPMDVGGQQEWTPWWSSAAANA